MPKRISNRNQQNIYCAYRIGTANDKTDFTDEIYTLRCQFLKHNGYKSTQLYGTTIDYIATAMFENDTATQYIDAFAKFWQSYKPENGNDTAEYKVAGINLSNDGLKVVYLNYVKPNGRDIWFVGKNNRIYSIEVEYDKESDKVYIPTNMYCTIDYNTKVWTEEPLNIDDKNHLKEVKFIEIVNNRKVIQLGDVGIE